MILGVLTPSPVYNIDITRVTPLSVLYYVTHHLFVDALFAERVHSDERATAPHLLLSTAYLSIISPKYRITHSLYFFSNLSSWKVHCLPPIGSFPAVLGVGQSLTPLFTGVLAHQYVKSPTWKGRSVDRLPEAFRGI